MNIIFFTTVSLGYKALFVLLTCNVQILIGVFLTAWALGTFWEELPCRSSLQELHKSRIVSQFVFAQTTRPWGWTLKSSISVIDWLGWAGLEIPGITAVNTLIAVNTLTAVTPNQALHRKPAGLCGGCGEVGSHIINSTHCVTSRV